MSQPWEGKGLVGKALPFFSKENDLQPEAEDQSLVWK
jgi:hypothetical protein